MTIWLASQNIHKKNELSAILGGIKIRIPRDAGIAFDPEENGSTFLDNALIKARSLYALVNEPIIADDSGICVDALGGRPGIYSARYGEEGGVKLSDRERNLLLLRETQGAVNRKARFICAMALYLGYNRFFAVQETLEGELIQEERGEGGFGYDPLLYLPDLRKTVAELSAEEKNRLSHRAKAGRLIARLIAEPLP